MLKSTKCFHIRNTKMTKLMPMEGRQWLFTCNKLQSVVSSMFLSLKDKAFNTQPLAYWLFITLLTYTPNYTDSILITKLRQSIGIGLFNVQTWTKSLSWKIQSPAEHIRQEKHWFKGNAGCHPFSNNTDVTITDYLSPSRYECYLYVKAE